MSNATPLSVCMVVSAPMTIRAFLVDQINALCEHYAITVVAHVNDPAELAAVIPHARVIPVAIVRPIAPWADVRALWQLYRLFRRERFVLVHSVTPKAGLLAMVAARLAGVPHRLHTFTGQVWATRRGFGRWLLRSLDRLLAAQTTTVLTDSASQRAFLLEQGVLPVGAGLVLGHGSISGVDTARFIADIAARSEIRSSLGLSEDVPLFLFLGRLNRDKGILDLAAAYRALCDSGRTAALLLVGPDEEGLRPQVEALCGAGTSLHFVDYTTTPQRYMAAADVFCLPSYREGFGSVVIEAASCGVPSIGSRIYGVSDAIVEGETGLLHAPAQVGELCAAMTRLVDEPQLRRALGEKAAQRARTFFAKEVLTGALVALYRQQLAGKIEAKVC